MFSIYKISRKLFNGQCFRLYLILMLLCASNIVVATNIQIIKSFNIPKQNAMLSLIKFAEQADITLLFPVDNLQNIKTNPLVGKYSISQALQLLIKGTGLKMDIDTKGELSIIVDPAFLKEVDLNNQNETALSASVQKNTSNTVKKDKIKKKIAEIEIITIRGVQGSIEQGMTVKRFSNEITDVILAEGIGQLPDENIAEALQRVTGVQMTRSADGEGSTIQIRGISNNNVEINGQTLSGTSADRAVNFQDIPSELFSSIEILKAPTADRIEGSLGGTVNLKTRRPLKTQEDSFATVAVKAKYSELTEEVSPNVNVFLGKNWRETLIGDLGIVVNGGRKDVITQTDAFGGGDFDDAPGAWYRQNASKVGAAPFNSGPWQTDQNIDVNGDGVSDNKDIFYVPKGFRTYSRYAETVKDSLNVMLNWQPKEAIELFLDYTRTDSQADEFGSQLEINNSSNALPLLQGNNTFTHLGNTTGIGDTYLLSSGLIGGTNLRSGGAPSQKTTWREAEKITFSSHYIINEHWLVSAEVNSSDGTSTTKQAQLNMGYDWNMDSQLDNEDWAGIVYYDMNNSDLVDYTLYEAPFYGGTGPLTPEELLAINPSNMAYDRLSYFQMQRNADDTKSQEGSFKLDFVHQIDDGFISDIKFGVRVAKRSFARQSYINSNQKKTKQDEDGFYEKIDIQDIKVHPDANSSAESTKIATDLQNCFGTTSIELDGVSGNFLHSWSNTNNCGSDFFTDYFNMVDIRSFSEELGKGLYEDAGLRYDVDEETTAYYLRADFITEISEMDLTGNFGVRYIETDTSSSGYLNSTSDSESNFEWLSFKGHYDNFLPSFNANLVLNDEMMLRFAAYKALSRPELTALAPSLKIKANQDVEGYAGTGTMGNPDLDPIRATNIDLSFEWYYQAASAFSVALFYKDIDSNVAFGTELVDMLFNAKLYRVRQKQNSKGSKLAGAEFSIVQTFDFLPSFLTYTGISANYTFTHENSKEIDLEGGAIARKGLSENSYNIIGFYDDNIFSLRLAYNWRSEFVRREYVSLGFNSPNTLPEIEEARGQLDLSAQYKINDYFNVTFSAINLNGSVTERYLKYKQLTNYLSDSGTRYRLGVSARF